MSEPTLVGTFANEHDLVRATAAARERGLRIVDAYAPYPVHGLDAAMGLKPSRLSLFCFACGAAGTVAAMLLQHWTMAIDWPINVGGRPFNSWPAFVPVAFEVLVLLAGFGVVFAFFAVSRLYPGKRAATLPMATDDAFLLELATEGAGANAPEAEAFLRAQGAVAIEPRSATPAPKARRSLAGINVVLAATFVVLVGLNWFAGCDVRARNVEFSPEMAHSTAAESQGPRAELPRGMVHQPPPEGTIARGQMPLGYDASPKSAERAGLELVNPLKASDERVRQRGAAVYANFCAVCHGPGGAGDGPATARGVPPPPSLLAEKALKTKDGQMFHAVTFGQGNMGPYAAQVDCDDRWATIVHIRRLQGAKGGAK